MLFQTYLCYPCCLKTPNIPFSIITPRILISEYGQSNPSLVIGLIQARPKPMSLFISYLHFWDNKNVHSLRATSPLANVEKPGGKHEKCV